MLAHYCVTRQIYVLDTKLLPKKMQANRKIFKGINHQNWHGLLIYILFCHFVLNVYTLDTTFCSRKCKTHRKILKGINHQIGIVCYYVLFCHKVNRCLARYSPRATTTNHPTNRAPNEPARPGSKWPISGQIWSFLGKKS